MKDFFTGFGSAILAFAIIVSFTIACCSIPSTDISEDKTSQDIQIVGSNPDEAQTISVDEDGVQIIFQDVNTEKRLLKLEKALAVKDSEITYLQYSIDSLKLKDKQIIRQYKRADKKLFKAMDTLIVW